MVVRCERRLARLHGCHREAVSEADGLTVDGSLQDEERDVWSRRRCGALGAEEDGECCCEAVQEGFAADRSDLAAAEEAGDGWAAERLGDGARVVVCLREQFVPRPLQLKRSAPAVGASPSSRSSASRRSWSALVASRKWKRSVWPMRTCSPTAIDPLVSSAPSRPRIR